MCHFCGSIDQFSFLLLNPGAFNFQYFKVMSSVISGLALLHSVSFQCRSVSVATSGIPISAVVCDATNYQDRDRCEK